MMRTKRDTSSNPSVLSPQSNDLSNLVERFLQQHQGKSSQPQPANSSSSSSSLTPSLKRHRPLNGPASAPEKERVRFDASTKTASQNSAPARRSTTLTTSQLLLQVRIVLKILEKDDPHLKHRLVQSIDRCRRTMPKGRAFNLQVDATMRRMVTPETYRTATEARRRLAAAAKSKASRRP